MKRARFTEEQIIGSIGIFLRKRSGASSARRGMRTRRKKAEEQANFIVTRDFSSSRRSRDQGCATSLLHREDTIS